MKRREAERLAEALQHPDADRDLGGRMAALVEVARRARVLAEPVAPPPRGLAPGRQRFLAEAARLRTMGRPARQSIARRRLPPVAVPRWAGAMVALVLVVGLLLGTGTAAASSLPGEPLYDLKLAGETVRLALTRDPLAVAVLQRYLARDRLDEIVALMEQGSEVDVPAAERAMQQLESAFGAALQMDDAQAGPALERLAAMVQQHQRTMAAIMAGLSDPEPPHVRQLVRVMERVRQEAHFGQGDPAGARQRMRQGYPSEAIEEPLPSRTPAEAGAPGSGPVQGAQPTEIPGRGPAHTTPPPVESGPQPGEPSGPGSGPGESPGSQDSPMPGSGSGGGGHGQP